MLGRERAVPVAPLDRERAAVLMDPADCDTTHKHKTTFCEEGQHKGVATVVHRVISITSPQTLPEHTYTDNIGAPYDRGRFRRAPPLLENTERRKTRSSFEPIVQWKGQSSDGQGVERAEEGGGTGSQFEGQVEDA